jgi:hypothetical protein
MRGPRSRRRGRAGRGEACGPRQIVPEPERATIESDLSVDLGSYGDSCWHVVWGSALGASLVMAAPDLIEGLDPGPQEFAAPGRFRPFSACTGEG